MREVRRLVGETSGGCLGFEGSRPRRPFRLSVRTTAEKRAVLGKEMKGSSTHPVHTTLTEKSKTGNPGPPHHPTRPWPARQVQAGSAFRGWSLEVGAGIGGGCPVTLAAPPRRAGRPVSPPTFLHHAHSQALLEAAELAAVPPPLVHRAVLVCQADVLGTLLYCALEGGRHGTGCQSMGGGAQGRGPSRSCCRRQRRRRRQKHSLFIAIFLTFGCRGGRHRGPERGEKSGARWGRALPQKEDSRARDEGARTSRPPRHLF